MSARCNPREPLTGATKSDGSTSGGLSPGEGSAGDGEGDELAIDDFPVDAVFALTLNRRLAALGTTDTSPRSRISPPPTPGEVETGVEDEV